MKPKDGDHISKHEGHEIVKSHVGMPGQEKVYLFCRDCKVEVTEKKELDWALDKLEDGLEFEHYGMDFSHTGDEGIELEDFGNYEPPPIPGSKL